MRSFLTEDSFDPQFTVVHNANAIKYRLSLTEEILQQDLSLVPLKSGKRQKLDPLKYSSWFSVILSVRLKSRLFPRQS